MTVTAYSYTRFSSAAQKEGDSLRRQLALADEWAAKHPDVVLDTTTRDLGVSAYHGEHRVKGALASFLKRIEKGQIAPGSYLLIEQFDRLTREAEVVAMNLLTSILLAKIRVVTLNDETELDETADAMDLMRAILSLSAGHIENKRRGGRLAEAWADKKRRARETGEILSKRGPAWTVFNETKKRFDLIPERADIVRRIFRECVEGFGSSTITNRLNEDPTVKPFVEGSSGFHAGYVLTILKSPSVVGTYTPTLWSKTAGERANRTPDGSEIEGYYPEVIDRDLFERVQAILAMRSKHPKRGRRGKTFPNILLGLGRCEACHGTLILGNYMNKERVRYFRCYNSSRGHRCGNKTRYPLPPIQERLENFLIKAKFEDAPVGDTHNIEPLLLKRSDLQRRIENLLDLMEAGEPVGDRLRVRRGELADVDKAIAQAKAADLLARHRSHRDAVVEALDWVQSFRNLDGDDLYTARAKANALLNDAFDSIMPVASGGMFIAKNERARWVGDNAMTDWFDLPDEVTGAALAKAKTPVIIQWGEVSTYAEAEAFRKALPRAAPDAFDGFG
ncbi:recombinase family protein [Brevundimonas sp. UBA7664]|uniref:recombinase family protein n=1 Tax=Brevundimonas sp. UBA7664 TaxID=1946141 RepID=UPI0025C23DA7|nr:recombinase family protein [Brevundimonas sp. UBA7664]